MMTIRTQSTDVIPSSVIIRKTGNVATKETDSLTASYTLSKGYSHPRGEGGRGEGGERLQNVKHSVHHRMFSGDAKCQRDL